MCQRHQRGADWTQFEDHAAEYFCLYWILIHQKSILSGPKGSNNAGSISVSTFYPLSCRRSLYFVFLYLNLHKYLGCPPAAPVTYCFLIRSDNNGRRQAKFFPPTIPHSAKWKSLIDVKYHFCYCYFRAKYNPQYIILQSEKV